MIKIQKEFQQEMFDLAAYAFSQNKSIEKAERFEYLAQKSQNYGSFADSVLASQVMATPFLVNFWNQTLRMTGIGYVSTYPEFRKQGRIDAIMGQMLQDSYKEKRHLSYLAPFSYPFYRRYGYESAFLQIRYEASAEKWPFGGGCQGRVQRVSFSEAKGVLKEIYQKSCQSQKGGILREEWWLRYKFDLHKDLKFGIYVQNDQHEGYVVYEIINNKLEIIELVALTQPAFVALHDFIKAHYGTVNTITWTQPFDGKTAILEVSDPQVKVEILPYMMARVVNVAAFLQAYPWQTKITDSFSVEIVEDSFLAINNGWYEVTTDGHVTRVEQSNLPFLKVSPQIFTQLFLGSVKLDDLLLSKKLAITIELVPLLQELLPKEMPLLGDYF